MLEIIIILSIIVLIRVWIPLLYETSIILRLLAELRDKISIKREVRLLEIITIVLFEWKKFLEYNKIPGRIRKRRYSEIKEGCWDIIGCR